MPQAKVLRLLRHDARSWWYFQTLRKQGQIEKAIELERQSIRGDIQFIRKNIGREAITHRINVIEFPNPIRQRPFSLEPTNTNGYTTIISGCHSGFLQLGFIAMLIELA